MKLSKKNVKEKLTIVNASLSYYAYIIRFLEEECGSSPYTTSIMLYNTAQRLHFLKQKQNLLNLLKSLN